jgi:hypothetical protein
MNRLRAEALSPIDAATLWPQLHRLDTEVVATRGGENLLVSSALAATGLTRLPRLAPIRRTAVVGLRHRVGYRGVLAARELAGGAAWEVATLRIRRDKDDDAVTALVEAIAQETIRFGARSLILRYAEGSPHADALRRGGMFAHRVERLFAVPPSAAPQSDQFRAANRRDRHDIFRLYCHAVPESIRRHEAATQQEWRAVLDSLECRHEYVLPRPDTPSLAGWVGIGDREAHVMVDSVEGAVDAALDLVETHSNRNACLVVGHHQPDIERAALARGYMPLGERLLCVRRLAHRIPLKEVVAVPADSVPLPQ